MTSPNSTSSLHDEFSYDKMLDSHDGLGKRAARDSPPTNINNSISRPPKRRAHKACLSCRNRKVRCDVVSRGQPCTNCRLDGVDCAVKESNRGRKPGAVCAAQRERATAAAAAAAEAEARSQSQSQSQMQPQSEYTTATPAPAPRVEAPRIELSPEDILSPPQQMDDDQQSNHAHTHNHICVQFDAPEPRKLSHSHTQPAQVPMNVDDVSPRDISQRNHSHVQNSNVQASHTQNGHIPHQNQSQHIHSGAQSNLSPISDQWIPRAASSPARPPLATNSVPRLPAYIRPVPAYLRQRDLQYLADSGALAIPDDAFRDELLRTYVHVVYPFMPTLDLEDLLGPIANPNDPNHSPVSLLLFQAIMFAGVTFVDAKFLHARGYDSRKAARKAFFSRVRLLYGLDYEQDRLPLLQAVLLMTYWYDCPDNDKDTWYWMGIALSLAQVSGYHREPAMPSLKQRRLRRRIWWSCVIRDRLLALGVRRPSRIYNDDFHVDPLSIDDFDPRMPSEPVARLLGDSRFASTDPSARIQAAVLVVELSKLCTCLGQILHSQYSITGSQAQFARSEYLRRAVVVPRESDTKLEDLTRCDADLEEWYANQDMRAKYTTIRTPRGATVDVATRVIHLHQAQLHMIYLTTVTVLHKPQVFSSTSNQQGCGPASENDQTNAQRRISKAKIMEAAVAVTNLAHSLKSSDQLRFLSTSSVPAFLSASLIHLMDTRSPDDDVRSISIGRFCQCVGALQQLQDIYSSADYAIYFLRNVLKNTNIDVPMVKLALMSPTADESSFQLHQQQQQQQRASRSASDCPSSSTRIWTPPYQPPSQSPRQSQTQITTQSHAQNQNQNQNQPTFYPELPLGRDTNRFADAGLSQMSQTLFTGQFNSGLSAANVFGGPRESGDVGDVIFDPLLMNSWLDIDVNEGVPPLSVNGFDVDGNTSVMAGPFM